MLLLQTAPYKCASVCKTAQLEIHSFGSMVCQEDPLSHSQLLTVIRQIESSAVYQGRTDGSLQGSGAEI